MGRNNQSLSEQLEKCNRRLEGHLSNSNSNAERFFRLLQRQAMLESSIGESRRSSGGSSNRGKNRK